MSLKDEFLKINTRLEFREREKNFRIWIFRMKKFSNIFGS